MKRRKFVSGAASIVAAELLPASQANAQAVGIPAYRTSQLISPGPQGERIQVQDLVLWDNLIYCLYSALPEGSTLANRSWGFSVTSADGSPVWGCDLPAAKYLTIGLQNGTVILTALTFADSSGRDRANCLIQVNPTGSTTLLDSLGASFKGRLVFAGDSKFVRLNSAAVDVWRLSGTTIQGGMTSPIQPWTAIPNVDLLTNNTLAITSVGGGELTTVDLSSDAVAEHDITAPEVKAAIAYYRSRAATHPTAYPGVIVATGSDGLGSAYGLVVPAAPSSVPMVKLSETGDGGTWKSVQLDSKVPARKLLLFSGEVGVAFADGSVKWYRV